MHGNGRSRKGAPKQKSNFLRYFEGYSEVRSVGSDGKVKVDMVYTAPYWVHDLTGRQWKQRKLCFAGLMILTVALYLCAAFMPLGENYNRYVLIPGGLTAALLLFFITYVITYLVCPRKMTIYDYEHNYTSVRRWSFMTAVGLAASGIMSVAYLILGNGDQWIKTLLCIVCYFAAAVSSFTIYKIEDKTEYYEEENENGNGYTPYSSY